MKKVIGLLLVLILTMGLLAGCVEPEPRPENGETAAESASEQEASAQTAETSEASEGTSEGVTSEESAEESEWVYEPFDYSSGLDENGFFKGITALNYVELCDYLNIRIPKEEIAATQEEIQAEIDDILAAYQTTAPVMDRAVQDGDTVNIDYVGYLDGVAFDGGNTMGMGTTVTIGVTNYIPGFLDQLIGHMPGEQFDINVTFPENYGNTDLAGKDAVFNIMINYIEETITPELTDEFVLEHLHKKFAKLLYGDIYYDEKNNKFTREMTGEDKKRTFVKYVLEPFYKIIGYSISEEKDELIEFLSKGFNLKNVELNQINFKDDPHPLLTQILTMIYGHYNSLVDICTKNIVDSEEGSKRKISTLYTGNRNTDFYKEIIKSSPDGPLICCVYKLYHKYDHLSFDLFGRVLSGTIKQKMKILIMGENYTIEETEDSYINEIKILQIHQTRYKITINKAPLGNFVLIDGSDVSLSKNLTIVEYDKEKKYLNQIAIFKPLLFDYSFMKVSVEPLNPLDLPKMVDGLRKINQSYPASKTKVEESGENIIMGTGELYFDNILNDLRNIYSDIEIKVSDPVVNFKETILETSSFKCNSTSLNNKNKIGIIAEPMNTEVVHDLNFEQIEGFNLSQGKTRLENLEIFKKYLINEKKWDKLTANSIWAFNQGSNILIDYTLPMENDTNNLYSVKNEIIQGFDWTCKEGPLINEPIVNSKFKILSTEICSDPVYKGSSQIIPMVRRACYSSFVTACPRLMEPMLIGEVHCTYECIRVLEDLLLRRRGHINSQIAMPGTPFYIVRYVLPALDSFGLEIDIRTTTAGQAFGMMWFNGFQTMQGDPLDKNIHYFPLEPSTNLVLAREVLIKTRRRKGLNEDINILNYLDEEGINNIKQDDEYKNYV